MTNAILDIFRRKKLFGYYFILGLTVVLISIFLSPLASFINMLYVIVTKVLIVVNDDL